MVLSSAHPKAATYTVFLSPNRSWNPIESRKERYPVPFLEWAPRPDRPTSWTAGGGGFGRPLPVPYFWKPDREP